MGEYTREYIHEGIVCRYLISHGKYSWYIPDHSLYFSAKDWDESLRKIPILIKISIEANEKDKR